MRLAVLTLRREPAYRRQAFTDGLKRLGYVVTDKLGQARPSGPDDLLVTWNLRAGLEEGQARLWEQRGGTVLVCENGYLQKVDKTIYAISTHGHNGSGWFPCDLEDRFSRLGFPILPWTEAVAGHVLVCGQRMVGSAAMRSPPQWGEKLAQKFGARGRFRPHPGNFAPKVSLEKDLEGASACHIWASAAGVLALTRGVVVTHHAPHWICDQPAGSRELRLNRMAHGQWSVAEIESGEPFARMQAENWGPRWNTP